MRYLNYRSIGLALVVGGVLIAVGLVPLIWTQVIARSHNWRPLTVPIELKAGESRSPNFTTDLNGRYLATLILDRSSDIKGQQCAMGITISNQNCERDKLVDFDYKIVSGDRIVKAGTYAPLSVSGSEVTFTDFIARKGDKQSIVLSIKKDGGTLNTMHPTLIIEAGPEYWEPLPEMEMLSWLWAAVICGAGLILSTVNLLNRRKRIA
jgi:hypothetical protein